MLQAPKSLYYTQEHLWLQKIGSVDFCVGITDFAQKETGEIDLIEFDFHKCILKKGTIWGTVYGINNTFNLVAPFDCKVIEANVNLYKHTACINTCPYEYWFAIIAPTIDSATLLNFDEYINLTHSVEN